MIFFIVVCIILVIAIPLLKIAQKKSGPSNHDNHSGNFSDDSNFYTSSASERYGEPSDCNPSNASDATTCNDASSDSSSDSGSCDSGGGDSGGSSD